MNNRTYDIAKQTAQVVLPAVGALYFALAQIWGFGYAIEVQGTIAALNAFVGIMVAFAAKLYDVSGAKYDGAVQIVEGEEGNKQIVMEVPGDPTDFAKKASGQKEVVFKVQNP